MVELWVINDAFCSFRLADGTREKKKSSSLAYQNTVTFLFPQENFNHNLLQQPTPDLTIVKLYNVSLKPMFGLFSFMYFTQNKTHTDPH